MVLTSLQLHSENDQPIELSEVNISNIQSGIQSDNFGLKMSSIYLAGKYKISRVSEDLVQELKTSSDEKICQMLVWSLYQIGDESCCEEMKTFVENHSSKKVRQFCNSLYQIKQYDSTKEKS